MKIYKILLLLSIANVAISMDLASFGPSLDSELPSGDDQIGTITLNVNSQLRFFGVDYTEIFVSTNGVISLGDDQTTVVSIPFPLTAVEPIIAPYFADVDTTGTGNIYYRQSTTSSDLQFATNLIRNGFAAFQSFTASQVIIVTWSSVGYFNSKTDKTNTYQCVLAWNPNGMSFAVFLYNNLQWTTGDINGGVDGLGGNPAQAGFDSGTGTHFSLPLSGTANVLNLVRTSNVNKPGEWVFRIDEIDDITSGAIVDCGQPDLPANRTGNPFVTLPGSSTIFNSTAVYSCGDEGFVVEGNTTRTCQSNGNWSGMAPTCVAINCGDPDLPADTTALNVNFMTTSFNSIAIYSCNETGYELDGPATRICSSDNMWSGTAPSCTLIVCDKDLLLPSNTTELTISAPRITFNSTATYSCSPGYAVRNFVTRTCLADKTWSGSPSVCELVDCGLPDTPQAELRFTLTNQYLDGIATYTCIEGYRVVGSPTRTCTDGMGWSGTAPTCRIVDCGSPPSPNSTDFLNIDIVQTTFQSVVTYSCIFGYRLVGNGGSNIQTCLGTGEWSGEAPVCQLIDCRRPTDHTSSLLIITVDSNTLVDGRVSYSCPTGYDLIGQRSRTCQESGLWSGLPPTCQIVDCGPPPTVGQESTVTVSSTTFNSIATYTCNQIGYEIVGDNTTRCMQNSEWSTPPRCQPVNCGPPESMNFVNLTNINFTTNSTLFNGVTTYTCIEEGFIVVGGSVTRRCDDNGNWIGTSPTTCQIVDCGTPDLPSFGAGGLEVEFDNTTFNESAFYNCTDESLTLVGEDERFCLATGKWSGDPPFCEAITRSVALGVSIGVPVAILLILVILLILLLVFCLLCCREKKPQKEQLTFIIKEENDNVYTNNSIEEPPPVVIKTPEPEEPVDPFEEVKDLDSVHEFNLHYSASMKSTSSSAVIGHNEIV